MVAVEAGFVRTPVVMTDVGIAGEIVVDTISGLVCPVGDYECLAEKIAHLASEPSYGMRLARSLEERLRMLPHEGVHVEQYAGLLLRTKEEARHTTS